MVKRKRVKMYSHDLEHGNKEESRKDGEESLSGDDPDPNSDDDTVKNAHDVGIDLDESEDRNNPQELDIAKDIEKAEEYKKTH